MKKFTFLLLMSVFSVMTAFAQDAPKINFMPDPNEPQTQLYTFTLTCNEGIKLSGKEGATISNPATGFQKNLVGMEIMKTMVTLDLEDYSSVKDPGNWIVRIPAGFFILGPDGATTQNEEIVVRYQIVGAESISLNLKTATPEAKSTLPVLEDIIMEFDHDVLNTQVYGIVYNANKDSVTCVTNTCEDKDGNFYAWNTLRAVLTDPIYEAGTYTISLPEGFAITSDGFVPSAAMSLEYTVDGSMASIDEVEAVADESVIYDLVGRRIERITKPGIYIKGGKKIYVK